MNRAKLVFLIASLLLLCAASGCNNSVDDMLGNYNGGFNTGYVNVSNKDSSVYNLEPDDSGYDQTKLLYDDYTVFDIGTINLAAPESCRNYKWVLTDPGSVDKMEPITIKYYDGSTSPSSESRTFVVYVPDSGLKIEHTYKLTLTVTGKAGGIYTDSCLIYIVKFYVNY